MPPTLDDKGARLLEYLVRIAPRIDPSDLSTFPTYSTVHAALDIPMYGRTWGDSLDRQGMGSVANWADENGYPSITGFIISGDKGQPADGYFKYYKRDPDADGGWWLDEVAKAKTFNWAQVISAVNATASPAVQSKGAPPTPNPPQNTRTIQELATDKSRFFLKSEWGPISNGWPALSFSKRSVGDYLNAEYNPAHDFIVYAGTSDPNRTEIPEYRQCLLSIIIAEPGEPIPTEQLVPWESWQDALKKHDKNWPYSFGVRAAWNLTDLPRAREITPIAYRALGIRSNWGGVAEILGDERKALLSLALEWVELSNRGVVQATAVKRDKVRDIRENIPLSSAIARMEALIRGRLGPGRTVWTTTPARSLPPNTNLIFLLYDKLAEQNNLCALCGKLMPLDTTKKLLQVSPDRRDSSNPSYGPQNLQITHLACNLAKNDGSTQDFEEWLQLISGNMTELE
jgi:hypothetical protein